MCYLIKIIMLVQGTLKYVRLYWHYYNTEWTEIFQNVWLGSLQSYAQIKQLLTHFSC
jgi:hypothetical protein